MTAQLNKVGFVEHFEKIVRVCVQNKYSEKSAKKLLALGSDPFWLAKVVVQGRAVASAGIVFCRVRLQIQRSRVSVIKIPWHTPVSCHCVGIYKW